MTPEISQRWFEKVYIPKYSTEKFLWWRLLRSRETRCEFENTKPVSMTLKLVWGEPISFYLSITTWFAVRAKKKVVQHYLHSPGSWSPRLFTILWNSGKHLTVIFAVLKLCSRKTCHFPINWKINCHICIVIAQLPFGSPSVAMFIVASFDKHRNILGIELS